MKKKIELTLVLDADDDCKYITEEEIKQDLEREINCCCWYYEVVDCIITDLDSEVDTPSKIHFKDRKEIEKQFFKWCEENRITKESVSLIAFMQSKGWLNEEKIKSELNL